VCKLIGFYNRDEKCLQCGTDWIFKYSILPFVCKGLPLSFVQHTIWPWDLWYRRYELSDYVAPLCVQIPWFGVFFSPCRTRFFGVRDELVVVRWYSFVASEWTDIMWGFQLSQLHSPLAFTSVTTLADWLTDWQTKPVTSSTARAHSNEHYFVWRLTSTLPSDRFAWWQAAQSSLASHFPLSRGPHVFVQVIAVHIAV